MSILLDHTIVPARDKDESARFFARIFGLRYDGPVSHFAPVRVNDTLTLDFDTPTVFAISGITPLYCRVETPRIRMSNMRAAKRGWLCIAA